MDAGIRKGIVNDAIAVGVATGVYGISFGAISVASGLNVWQTCALSLLMFTGASQYALVGVVGAGGAPMTGAAAALPDAAVRPGSVPALGVQGRPCIKRSAFLAAQSGGGGWAEIACRYGA